MFKLILVFELILNLPLARGAPRMVDKKNNYISQTSNHIVALNAEYTDECWSKFESSDEIALRVKDNPSIEEELDECPFRLSSHPQMSGLLLVIREYKWKVEYLSKELEENALAKRATTCTLPIMDTLIHELETLTGDQSKHDVPPMNKTPPRHFLLPTQKHLDYLYITMECIKEGFAQVLRYDKNLLNSSN